MGDTDPLESKYHGARNSIALGYMQLQLVFSGFQNNNKQQRLAELVRADDLSTLAEIGRCKQEIAHLAITSIQDKKIEVIRNLEAFGKDEDESGPPDPTWSSKTLNELRDILREKEELISANDRTSERYSKFNAILKYDAERLRRMIRKRVHVDDLLSWKHELLRKVDTISDRIRFLVNRYMVFIPNISDDNREPIPREVSIKVDEACALVIAQVQEILMMDTYFQHPPPSTTIEKTPPPPPPKPSSIKKQQHSDIEKTSKKKETTTTSEQGEAPSKPKKPRAKPKPKSPPTAAATSTTTTTTTTTAAVDQSQQPVAVVIGGGETIPKPKPKPKPQSIVTVGGGGEPPAALPKPKPKPKPKSPQVNQDQPPIIKKRIEGEGESHPSSPSSPSSPPPLQKKPRTEEEEQEEEFDFNFTS